jgi:hypothetical protein
VDVRLRWSYPLTIFDFSLSFRERGGVRGDDINAPEPCPELALPGKALVDLA